PLAAGQQYPALTDLRIQPERAAPDDVGEVHRGQDGVQLRVRRVGYGQPQVVPDGTGEYRRLLLHAPQVPARPAAGPRAHAAPASGRSRPSAIRCSAPRPVCSWVYACIACASGITRKNRNSTKATRSPMVSEPVATRVPPTPTTTRNAPCTAAVAAGPTSARNRATRSPLANAARAATATPALSRSCALLARIVRAAV